MELHTTQSQVVKSQKRYRVVNCGRQWGKTELAVWEMIATAYSRSEARVLYFATTIDQARDIAWARLKKYANAIIVDKPNESRLELTVRNKLGSYSQIKLAGYENVETQRGKQFDLIVADEVSKMRNFGYAWTAILRPTLAFRKGNGLFISTPRGFNHFHEMYQWGQQKRPEWESWHFTSYDNPFLPVEEIEAAKRESTPEWFSQEWLAEFTRFTGLIIPEFDSDKHVHWFDHTMNDPGDYLFGMDFAVRGWTANIPSLIKPNGHIYLLDNYKELNLTTQQHGDGIKIMLRTYADLEKYTGYGDPAGWMTTQQGVKETKPMTWSIADEYLEQGFPLTRGNNEVTAGINYMRQLFKNNMIHIHPRCTKLIEELFQYQWKDQPTTQVGEVDAPEKVRKINDHLVDSLRYLVYSKPTAPDAEVPYQPGMPIDFGPPKIEPDRDDLPGEPFEFPSIYDTME